MLAFFNNPGIATVGVNLMQCIHMQRVKTSRRQAPPAPSIKAAVLDENVGPHSAVCRVVTGLAKHAGPFQRRVGGAGVPARRRIEEGRARPPDLQRGKAMEGRTLFVIPDAMRPRARMRVNHGSTAFAVGVMRCWSGISHIRLDMPLAIPC